MSTVIIGGGIIGLSTAFYLSEALQTSEAAQIHVVEASSEPLVSASGFAGGFVAPDWFSAAVAPLGRLSFDLHETLAKAHDGTRTWGFGRSTSLSVTDNRIVETGSERGDEWIQTGSSRLQAASGHTDLECDEFSTNGVPAWLHLQKSQVEPLGAMGSCAQVDPLRLCQFLLQQCLSRGVKLHLSTTVDKVIYNEARTIESVRLSYHSTASAELNADSVLTCNRLVLTAGAWTGRVFKTLFPMARIKLPIGSLAGYSLVVKSPHLKMGNIDEEWHAVFASKSGDSEDATDFSPELFSRTGGVSGEPEIYIAGLNDADLPLPPTATGAAPDPSAIRALVDRARQMLSPSPADRSQDQPAAQDAREVLANGEIDIRRTGLCWRPVTSRGHAIIGRINDKRLGDDVHTAPGGGVYVAAGHGPWGISLSLGTGKVMSELVRGEDTSCDISGLLP